MTNYNLLFTITMNNFYPTLTLETAAFVTCWAVKKWGNARPYTKSRTKSEEKRCKNRKKTLLGRLCLFGNGKTRLLFGRLWNAVIKWKWRTATKVRSSHCVRNTTHDVQCLKIFVFENIFDNCFVTICHFWFQNIFDNFCHFWFENMFDNCFVIICHLSPYLHKSCLISW